MEGQLEGKIVNGRYKGCRVRASYVINYDPGVASQNTGVWRGTGRYVTYQRSLGRCAQK